MKTKHETTNRYPIKKGLRLPLLREIYRWSETLEIKLTTREAEKLAGVCMERHSHPHGGRLCH
jgi:hypothetical protein